MKAMVITGFGGTEVFEQRDVPRPEPGPGQLLVRVHATSVNPVDYKLRHDGSWAGIEPPAIIGYDVAGIVEATGPQVKEFRAGDAVFYTPEIFGSPGSYAEFHVVNEAIVERIPEGLSFEEAAALPLAGCTAWEALVDRAAVRVGETVLIHAGAGGVGSLAVQIARACGARVLATCRTESADLVRSLGADVTIDYRGEDFVGAVLRATGGRGVDVAFDTVGGETFARTLEALAFRGRLVTIVETATGDLSEAFGKNVTVHFEFMQRARRSMTGLRTLVERGALHAVVDAVLPLERVADAHARLEAGGVRGKIVLAVHVR